LKNILDITGKKMVMLGGEHVWRQRITGDVVSEFKWIDGEPHMILYRAVPTTKTGAYLIDMNDAHKYADSRSGGPSPTLMQDAIAACKAIGFYDDKFAVMRVMDIILDGLPDLLAMPPEPKASEIANRPTTGNDEISIKVNGQTVIEAVV
jgi:hypothetical protein